MSNEVAPEVEVPTPEAPKREHWKVRQKREREEAAAAARANGTAEMKVDFSGASLEPKPAATEAPGFLSWSDFCNAVAIDLVTSQFGFQMLTNYTGDEAGQVFYSRMRLAYDAMKKAHARGAAQGS